VSACSTCGIGTTRPHLCNFCQRTVELIRSQRCVSCTATLDQLDTLRQEGRCAKCRSRNVKVAAGTRRLLLLAAKARYRERAA
jgi:hypothetical protein